jgi:anti-sigma28 factor (negative regulator of flagellin synthesis)
MLLMGAHAEKNEPRGKKAHRSKQTISPPQPRQVVELETRLEAMRDGEARVKRVEALQALVQADAYQIDSDSLAEKIVHTPHMLRLLGVNATYTDAFLLADE